MPSFSIPTSKPASCKNPTCENMHITVNEEKVVCPICNEKARFGGLCRWFSINMTTLLPKGIPTGHVVMFKDCDEEWPGYDSGFKFFKPEEIMDKMMEGWELISNESYFARGNEINEPKRENATTKEEKMEIINILNVPESDITPKHNKENIKKALENLDILNAAITHIGNLQTDDELASGETSHLNGQGFHVAYARTGRRLWMWVTGKDPKTMEVRWDPKCLSHTRTDGAFTRQVRNYDNISTAIGLATHVAAFHWRQLAHILEADFTGINLPKVDIKASSKPSPVGFSLSGAEVISTSGGGTQILWDSRRIWLPSSRIKKVGNELQIPQWLAQKNKMI